jgi:hypothetical protein
MKMCSLSAHLWTDEVGYECPPLDRCRWGMSAHLWTDAGGVYQTTDREREKNPSDKERYINSNARPGQAQIYNTEL